MSSNAADSTHGRKPRLLIVDDDSFLLRSLARLLMLHGLRVVTAPNGATALDVLAVDRDFDLVVFDMDMPPMHGPEFLPKALEVAPELRGRFVVASGNLDEQMRGLAAAGPCRMLQKPYSHLDVGALLTPR